jgi:hypothetical protein
MLYETHTPNWIKIQHMVSSLMLGHKWVDVVSIWGILALVCEEFLKMF